MTPAARIAAASQVLDRILNGERAEPALSGWARSSRYAGSKDRAAVRDLVFDALRRKRSYAVRGGQETGRGLMIGALREAGVDPAEMLTGAGYALPGLTDADFPGELADQPEAVRLDMPDWLAEMMMSDLQDAALPAMAALRDRAPVFVRVNIARTTIEAARQALAEDEIVAQSVDAASTALRVDFNERRIAASAAFCNGLIELQDAASQAAVLALPLQNDQLVLDYCAGGGGKSLAICAAAKVRCFAHDALPKRMKDLPARAARAGATVGILEGPQIAEIGPFDLVLVDAPCSGSGTWRRDPDAKWRLAEDDLARLVTLQAEILDKASMHVRPGGTLAYATCSVLAVENSKQAKDFLSRNSGWTAMDSRQWHPGAEGDGFFLALFRRAE